MNAAPEQLSTIRKHCETLRYPDEKAILQDIGVFLKRDVTALDELTAEEAQRVADKLEESVAVAKDPSHQ